jgi:HEAT repeat protein
VPVTPLQAASLLQERQLKESLMALRPLRSCRLQNNKPMKRRLFHLTFFFFVASFSARVPILGDDQPREVDGEKAFAAKYAPLTKDSLIAALYDERSDVRGFAADKLVADWPKEALPYIELALAREPVLGAQINLALRLARLGSAEGVTTLKLMCQNAGWSPSLRMDAAQALLFVDNEDCLPEILYVLRAQPAAYAGPIQEDEQAVWHALDLLTKLKHMPARELQEARSIAVALLNTNRLITKMSAAQMLGKLGDSSSAEALRRALATEQDESARRSFTNALKLLEGK